MTAWQDQPPQSNKPLSRRQVRQNERGDATNAVVDLPPQPGEQPDFSSFAREGWETEARRIAAAQQAQQQQPASRRSQRPLQAVDPSYGSGEPLEYLTQGSPQAQSPDAQPTRRRSAPAVQPTSAPSAFDQQSYRVRDFSPESRPSFSSTTPETPERAIPENLQYRTQGTPPSYTPPTPAQLPVSAFQSAPVQAAPFEPTALERAAFERAALEPATVEPAAVESPVEERTLSRRELRAMEAAQQPVAAAPQALPLAPEQPQKRSRSRGTTEPQGNQDALVRAEFDALAGSAPQQLQQSQGFGQPEPFAQQPSEPSTWTPPTGHWSTQAMIDDDEQVQENTLSRNVGATSGAITTSVLVLPSLPSDNLTRPLGSTGEILITGTIDLPHSLGTTGAHPGRYDHSDVDAFLEAGDREDSQSNPDSAPVRAISAVSTHTSTRGVMDAKKPKGNSRLPLILGVAATVMAVGVVVLVVCAMLFGVFK